MSRGELSTVEQYTGIIEQLLIKARLSKPLGQINPPLTVQDIADGIQSIAELSAKLSGPAYASIETACREIFYRRLASTNIADAHFGDIWNLFDIVSAASDQELCEPSLIFWLIEELLDSQTIDGCRTVFDYLDSRRHSLTSKNFKAKSLVILRSCNELLRRLSRAEDTVLCGRVFNFLFQSFPLGDKSSVNLRGEYHSENVTTFETVPVSDHKGSDDAMEVDGGGEEERGKPAKRNSMDDDQKTEKSGARIQETIKDVKANEESDAKHEAQEIGPDQLYQTFWSLQKYYSQPTSLFDEAKLAAFKRGLEITMHKFKSVQQERTLRAPPKTTEEGTRGLKRKRTLQNEELSSAFNPKYLTSRDLFDLELSDLSFRRHILVQALILLDFVLSLTPKAKKKLEHMSNRSVLYTYTLSEEDAKWAASTRQDVANYLQEGPEGKFFYRMVATVLSRDKNWTRWKAEACPPILKPAMSISDFEDALKGAQRTFADKKLRSAPMGSLNLDFLSHTGGDESMESLKNPERYEIPSLGSFERPLADDEFDLEMARDDEEKHAAEDAKSSKLWRALRIASRTKLGVLDKVDDGKNVKVLFQTPANNAVEEKPAANEEPEKEGHLSDAKEEDLSSKIDDGGIVDSIGTPNGVQETPVDDGKVNNGNCQPQHAEEQSAESVVK